MSTSDRSPAISDQEHLARKISRAKWDERDELADGEIAADAVTGDLRTRGNALSLWLCGSGGDSEIRSVVLALAAAGDRLDKFDIAWVPVSDLERAGISLKSTAGETRVAELRNRHVDAGSLDAVRLARFAEVLGTHIRAGACRRLTRSEVLDVLRQAVRDEVLDPEELPDKLRDQVSNATRPS